MSKASKTPAQVVGGSAGSGGGGGVAGLVDISFNAKSFSLGGTKEGSWRSVVVAGAAGVGKTAVLQQLIYGNHKVGQKMFPTIEDIYPAYIESDVGKKEKIHFYDTAGVVPGKGSPDIEKHYLSFADGVVLVYDVTEPASFEIMGRLKEQVDRGREPKKEIYVIALGNKCDIKGKKKVDFQTANRWAQREKVRLWEISAANRACLLDPFTWMTSKVSAPPTKASFPAFSKKNKE